MVLISLAILIAVLLLTAFGMDLLKRLNISGFGYHAPFGMVFFIAMLQILYYPVQILNGSFYILLVETCLVGLYLLYCLIKEWKNVWDELLQKKTLWVIGSVIFFFIVFSRCYVDLEHSDSVMYLNYVAQNIGNPHINLFHLYNGLIGQEWDALYLYQGYYHFMSCFVWLINVPSRLGLGAPIETLKVSVWGMGLLYNVISSMFFVSMIDSLKTTKRSLNTVLKIFVLFYLNFYYWRVVFSYYGNTWRSFYITMLMYVIYMWLKGKVDNGVYYLIPAISFAGLASSSSYLFISFAVLSILAAYLFLIKRDGSFYEMSIFVLPLCVYATIMIIRMTPIGYGLLVFFVWYYLSCRKKSVMNGIAVIEEFLIKHANVIFYYFIPGVCALFALYIHYVHPEFLYGYSYYFNNHQDYDMVKDYFFVYSRWYDNILNVIRWFGVILIMKYAKTEEDCYIKTTFILMLLVFMNPLCTPTIAYTIASNVFYRAWEVMFNPFTETLIIIAVYRYLAKKNKQVFVSIALMISLISGTVLSFQKDLHSSYGFYMYFGQDVNGISKLEDYEEDAIKNMRYALQQEEYDRQPVIISHAEGTRIYIPNAYLLVTPRDLYYPHTRINEELYQIARRHHPWDEDQDIDYSKTKELMDQYKVDYVLVRYYENPEFDQALDPISEVVYDNGVFKLRKIIH